MLTWVAIILLPLSLQLYRCNAHGALAHDTEIHSTTYDRAPMPDLPPDAPLQIGVMLRPPSCYEYVLPGKRLRVRYRGWVRRTGKVFHELWDNLDGRALEFTVGENKVMPGLEKGVLGACHNEWRRLTLPGNLGFGAKNAGKIHPNATLVMDVFIQDILASDTT